ncbi:hypothetical protein DEU56DRAFT_914675 [Suillus clintonianus]|uniref:uncharacterized protein n=1 Tax=Suillus clintonianus TaxID=1904413 RepID=UPI001B8721DC|nr:uncharacterized protein DEU56DRAFT_914675 [Suillus clintonianus]KAG2130917.1 hypothetical protein DEU56DRAFT_914675 [Suillus clintonianus]
MPPKKSKGGGENTKADGASVLHMNNRPIEAIVPTTDIAKETQKLDSQVAKCKVGVAWVDLLAIAGRLKFGVYNDRPQNESETNKLVGSFETSGIVSMKDVAAIPLIMKTSRLKDAKSLVKNFDDPEEVLELEMRDLKAIVVASGQHRLAALQRYNQSLLDEYSALETKREKINALKHLTTDHIATYNDCHTAMCRVKGLLYGIGKWGVTIYDEDKLLAKGNELANHLSRNSSLHEYKETEEEVLITLFKQIKVLYDSSPVNERDRLAVEHLLSIRTSQEKNARLHKVLEHETLCVFLATRLLQLGPHFRHRREFTVNWLAKSINVCMGMYLQWIKIRIETLRRLSSKAMFPSYAEVTDLLEKADARDAAAIAKVAELRTLLLRTPKAKDDQDLSLWANVMDGLDKNASSALSKISEHMGEMSPVYIAPLSIYRQSVVKTLQDGWGLTSNEDYEENEILAHLDRVVARVLLYLTPEQGQVHAPEPLLCGFVMNESWDSFVRIQDGLAEVCRWFESLLDYYRMLHPKTHTMDDWSTVMLQNITNDSRFLGKGHEYSAKIAGIIWEHRRTLMVRLTNYMINMKQRVVPRAKDKKELMSAYERLPSGETIASEALTKILMERRMKANKNRDLASQPSTIAGTLALHTTSWDWLSPTLKNAARDIDPCMKAIAVERFHISKYRPKMVQDKFIGALRWLLQDTLTRGVTKIQTMDYTGQLVTEQEWKWWDAIVLSPTQEEPDVVLQGIKDTVIREQRQLQERLVLENNDREAIQKLVAYISNMPCALSSSPNNILSADVVTPLKELITGLEINAARNRTRLLNKDPNMLVDLDQVNFDLHIPLSDGYFDDLTTGYGAVPTTDKEGGEQESEEERPPTPKEETKKGKARVVEEEEEDTPVPETEKKGKARAGEQQDTPVPAPATTQPSAKTRSKSALGEAMSVSPATTPQPAAASQPAKRKARPVAKKQRQPSPPAMDVDEHAGSENVAQRASSPIEGFSTTDVSWYDPNAENLKNDGQKDAENQDVISDVDERPGHALEPTQPTSPLSSPPVSSPPSDDEERVTPVASSSKRDRAATVNSSTSSTTGRGRKNKKKAKIVHRDDSEGTFIPGV